jgi:hypothetical protein
MQPMISVIAVALSDTASEFPRARVKVRPERALGSDPNGVVRNASQGFGGAARQAIVNAGEKRTPLKWRGSPDLSPGGIQSPKRGPRAVSEVRTVRTNPFENTENSAPFVGVSVDRCGSTGGSGGIRTHGGVPPTLVFKTRALNHSATLPAGPASATAPGVGPEACAVRAAGLLTADAGNHIPAGPSSNLGHKTRKQPPGLRQCGVRRADRAPPVARRRRRRARRGSACL